jgi:monoamine oxidase
MSRTPLFRLLQRSMRLAQASLELGQPLDEIIDRSAQASQLTRRQFVGGVAGATAALAIEGCVSGRSGGNTEAQGNPNASVLIVGAGIAGLTAAYRLQQHGVRARVIEAQDRVGGRMYSLRGKFPDGQVCELGGELIDSGHSHIRALSAELGIVLDDLRGRNEAGLNSDVWYFGGELRSDAEIIAALEPVVARLALDRKTWPDDFDPTYHNTFGAEKLDRMTIAMWLDQIGVKGWLRELFDVAYLTEYGIPIDRQSALNLLTMIQANMSDFKLYGVSDERYHVHAGNDTIPRTLAQRLGDVIETGTVLEAISLSNDGAFACALRRGGSSVTATASHVLLAIPFSTLRDVRLDVPLPSVKLRAIRELTYGTNAKLMVGFSERVWRTRHHSNGSAITSLPFQTTWETSRGQAGNSGILTNFTGGAHALELGQDTAEAQATRMLTDLECVFPGVQAAHVGMPAVRFHWPSFPWTRGSYAGYLAGQWTSIRGSEGESSGRLFFAGEHCSLAAQGFMEGGCETGERAATEILTSLGVPVHKTVQIVPSPINHSALQPERSAA